jgi:hypothetical protein
MGLRRSQKSIEPMTLGNMRANGVRSLAIRCGALWCNHEAILDAGSYSDEVPSFSPRMVCTIAARSAPMPGRIGRNAQCPFGTTAQDGVRDSPPVLVPPIPQRQAH